MATREDLLRRPDVPNEDIDDLIGIAQELQDAERRARGASVAEVEAVAAELEIDPAYVQQAIDVLRDRRAQDAEAAAARSASTRRALLIGGAALLGVLGVGGGVGAVSASRGSAARQELARAEANLDVVLQRQAALAPQLVAIAGGEAEGLEALAAKVREGTVEERMRASEALGAELAKRLGALPPATTDAAAQQRLSLQHELSGAQNRITVERRRYEEARLAAEQASGCGG
jgi:hypothetical protein